MAIPSWPAAVPYQPHTDLWDRTPARDHLATEMESGDVRVRRRPARLDAITWGRILTQAQFAALDTFLEVTTHRAASRFRMRVTFNGSTFEERTVQIQPGSLKISHVGAGPQVVFSLWVFPATVVS